MLFFKAQTVFVFQKIHFTTNNSIIFNTIENSALKILNFRTVKFFFYFSVDSLENLQLA